MTKQWGTNTSHCNIVDRDGGSNAHSPLPKHGMRPAGRSEGEENWKLLGQAVGAYRNALQVYTRERLPQGWAMTQNSLGITLEAQGERSEGEESWKPLEQAAARFPWRVPVQRSQGRSRVGPIRSPRRP
jgi:hypothetical protein